MNAALQATETLTIAEVGLLIFEVTNQSCVRQVLQKGVEDLGEVGVLVGSRTDREQATWHRPQSFSNRAIPAVGPAGLSGPHASTRKVAARWPQRALPEKRSLKVYGLLVFDMTHTRPDLRARKSRQPLRVQGKAGRVRDAFRSHPTTIAAVFIGRTRRFGVPGKRRKPCLS
jgi:hypothetical protein